MYYLVLPGQLILLFLLLTTSLLTSASETDLQEDQPSRLRVLTWSGDESYLPRSGYPLDLELQYLKQFSKANNLTMTQIKVTRFEELIPRLLAGEGDIIAANFTITGERKKHINFTEPFLQTYEYLVMGKTNKALESSDALNKRELVIQKAKASEYTAAGLKKAYPGLKIRYIPTNIPTDLLYDKLASGEYDLAILDKNKIKSTLKYRDDIKMSLQASKIRHIAWAVAPDNQPLLIRLNRFIAQVVNVKKNLPKSDSNHWKNINDNKTIRFVMRNNLSSYYIWRGELLGFDYELARQFAKDKKLRYEIIVAPDHTAMLDYLIEGKADIALGYLTPTAERQEKGIAFSRPYHYASELVIGRADDDRIKTINDLSGRTLYLRRSSSYWASAKKLQNQVTNLKLVAVAETEETESIIERVANGDYDLTIADSHIVDMELTFRDDIQSFMAIGEPKPQSWAIKQGHTDLMKNIDQFIKKHYRGLFYNVVYNKYFKNKRRLDTHYNDYTKQKNTGTLSPYDSIIKKYATLYNFDWRLMVAQMHQESRFDPKAQSMAGAQGLFQVMPKTAEELGIGNMTDPQSGIQAGIRYMDWVRERMQHHDIQPDQLIWFTLACYNAGTGHVRDAIRLAKQQGLRGDLWFDNVEKAMLLLSQRKYAAKSRYGYVRGQEPVNYVRAIKRRFQTYRHVVDHSDA